MDVLAILYLIGCPLYIIGVAADAPAAISGTVGLLTLLVGAALAIVVLA